MRAYTLSEALRYGHGVERSFLCPVHGDSSPSASVNVVKGKWYCYACGAHGGITGEDALVEPDYEEMRNWWNKKLRENHVYPERWLDQFDAAGVHPYWEARVGALAARHFRLGYDPETDAGTYPLRDREGRVLGVVRRALGDSGPKYLYPEGIDVSRLLFNYTTERLRSVVLVEGALDAVALWRVGVHAMAIYGSHFTQAQAALLDRVDPDYVYTAYDRDDAGWKAFLETRSVLRRPITRLTWPRAWGKDVGELSEERLRNVVSNVVSDEMSCVESSTCETSRPRSRSTLSPSSSTPRRLVIVPRHA